jgi:YD repeat-containing protein
MPKPKSPNTEVMAVPENDRRHRRRWTGEEKNGDTRASGGVSMSSGGRTAFHLLPLCVVLCLVCCTFEPPAPSNMVSTLSGPETSDEHNDDTDLRPTRVALPDGSEVVLAYDARQRLVSLTTPLGDTTYDYSPDTGQLVAVTAPDGESLDLTRDGFLPESMTWSGTVRGTVRWEHGDDLRPTGVTVAGVTVPTTFDDDDLLVSAGELTVTRDPTSGLPEATALGGVSTTANFDAFAQLTAHSAAFGADELFAESLELDALGRITAVDERVQGEAVRREVRYDAAGRLEEVREDGVVVVRYSYDANGNRTSIEDPVSGEVIDAEHDAQDRLVRQGTATFEWNERGSLVSRADTDGTTHYDFDVMGALRSVTLPDGTVISYVIDPAGRRIGRRVDGTLERAWLYGDGLHPVAELDGAGRVVSRFVYGTRANVPDSMVRDGTTYRIVSDVRGSVRLVVNAATGEVAQRMDYDAWGNVLLDTNPGFQPFGFAGGLYDSDTGLVRFGARDYDPETGR